MLPGGEEGSAGKQVRIPQGYLPLRNLIPYKGLPLVILQNHIRKQMVLRYRRRLRHLAISGVGQILKQILGRKQRAIAQGLLMKHQQGENQQERDQKKIRRWAAANEHQRLSILPMFRFHVNGI